MGKILKFSTSSTDSTLKEFNFESKGKFGLGACWFNLWMIEPFKDPYPEMAVLTLAFYLATAAGYDCLNKSRVGEFSHMESFAGTDDAPLYFAIEYLGPLGSNTP